MKSQHRGHRIDGHRATITWNASAPWTPNPFSLYGNHCAALRMDSLLADPIHPHRPSAWLRCTASTHAHQRLRPCGIPYHRDARRAIV